MSTFDLTGRRARLIPANSVDRHVLFVDGGLTSAA